MADILFPPGRMIGGDVDKLFPRTDDNNQPKIGKDGQPEMQCSIGYAIPKGPEKAWWETPWGAEIYKVGAAAHPNIVASPSFSWKVTDGDSAIPNKKGKKPCDQTGYPSHWILWFSQGWLPKRVNSDGTVELSEGAIIAGYYIQVYGSVNGNKPKRPTDTAGVYLNPIAIALVGHGDKIASSVDTTAVGFGGAPLPAGAQPVAPVVPSMPPMGAPPAMPGAAAPPPVPPQAVTPPPAAPAGPVMLPAAGGQTYAAMIAVGWTDALLVQHGMMQAPAAAPTLPPGPPTGAPPQAVVPPTAPSQTFLTPGAPPAAPAPAAPPPAPIAPVMLAKAAGVTYDQFKAQNWTDQQLREQGYMQ